jgi:sodium-dependent dicarboxylate transporter 2/3/5
VLAWLSTADLPFPDGKPAGPGRMALAVTVLTAGCWLLRALPLAAASLLPLALFPVLHVQSTRQVAAAYADPILWMFFGGFIIALAIERCGLHRRMALRVIGMVGARPRRLVLGFVLAATAISMWINNTATTLMLFPVTLAIVARFEAEGLLPGAARRRFGVALLLGIAYGASIGGVGTPIGTAPNLLFFKNYAALEQAGAPPFAFLDWMLAFVPFALVFALIAWSVLVHLCFRLPDVDAAAGRRIVAEVAALPRMTSAERRTLALFLLAVILWLTRGDVRLGGGTTFAGWGSRLAGEEGYVQDGAVAVLVAILLFAVPRGGGERGALLDWATARRMPYAILLLMGGGVAIAGAFESTGLDRALGAVTAPELTRISPFWAVALTTLFMTVLTEITSNTAITALMLPLLHAAAQAAHVDPRLLMLPATIAASCGFMLPIGTPPNAIAYSSGRVSIGEMARAGVVLDVLSAIVLTLVFWFWALPLLGIDPYASPAWLK